MASYEFTVVRDDVDVPVSSDEIIDDIYWNLDDEETMDFIRNILYEINDQELYHTLIKRLVDDAFYQS